MTSIFPLHPERNALFNELHSRPFPVLGQGTRVSQLTMLHQGSSMADEALLKGLIERHLKLTGSLPARRILEDWAAHRTRFVKVMPHEYRRALTELAAQQQLENA